jgi:hypothetical protein
MSLIWDLVFRCENITSIIKIGSSHWIKEDYICQKR